MKRAASRATCQIVSFVFLFLVLLTVALPSRVEAFEGTPGAWHEGFARYDYLMDEATLEILPFKAPEGENFAVRDPEKGKRRCVVVVPKNPAPGNPWSWQGCYWDHQPQTEIELLKRGFHIAYVSANAGLKPGKEWDAWYEFLTGKNGLSPKPAFIGMSRGGEYAYTWAVRNPAKVACIYADNPGGNAEVLAGLGGLAANDVPLLHVCGSVDPLLGRFSASIETIYQQLGGRISVILKDGAGHHPHSLHDPKPMADFIEAAVRAKSPSLPAYVVGKSVRVNFYGAENLYQESAGEGTSLTTRGPFFTPCYDRHSFELEGVEGSINVIVPAASAAGHPWVYRVGVVDRDAAVDLALLAKGFHIITGPVSYNKDGPDLQHWNAVYQHLVKNGFSSKPVLEGAGRAAAEAYAWAIANPGKVSCVYAENPVLSASFMSKQAPSGNLAPLAEAGVPIYHVCGALDPALDGQTRLAEKRYKELGGKITVQIQEGTGHYPLSPRDPSPAVGFITAATRSN